MKATITGLNDSLTLLAFKITQTPTWAKVVGAMFVGFTLLAVIGSLQTISFIRMVMTGTINDSPATATATQIQNFLSQYLTLYVQNDTNLIISVAVALLIGSILFVPFSGYVIHGTISDTELVTIKKSDYYKIGDSILFQIISSFTFIQLVGITIISQLLAFDAPYPNRVVFVGWGIWVFMTVFTITLSWTVEFLKRRLDGRSVTLIFGIVFLVLFAAITFDENHGLTLFGFAPVIQDYVNLVGAGDQTTFLISLAVIVAASILMLFVMNFVAVHTLQLQEPALLKKDDSTTYRNTKKPTQSLLTLTLLLIQRYSTILKPTFTAVVFSVIIVLVIKGQAAITTTMIVIPLAVVVGYGANIYGLYTGALNWIMTLPNGSRQLFHNAAITTAVSILGAYTVVYGTGLVFGAITLDNVILTLPNIAAITAAATITSLMLSIHKPLPFSGKTRENLVSNPTTLIGYVTLVTVLTSILNSALSANPDLLGRTLTAVGVVLLSAFLYLRLLYKWEHNPEIQQNLLKSTTNAS